MKKGTEQKLTTKTRDDDGYVEPVEKYVVGACMCVCVCVCLWGWPMVEMRVV